MQYHRKVYADATRSPVIILTSNLGSTLLMQEGASDPTTGQITPEAKQAVLDLVQLQYPPELINRLDEQIVFNRKCTHR